MSLQKKQSFTISTTAARIHFMLMVSAHFDRFDRSADLLTEATMAARVCIWVEGSGGENGGTMLDLDSNTDGVSNDDVFVLAGTFVMIDLRSILMDFWRLPKRNCQKSTDIDLVFTNS